MKENLVADLAFDFAVEIISLHQKLCIQKEYILSRQLLRSGTSIGANIEEAAAGLSRKDFISKISIAAKEAREARYWLRLFDRVKLCGLDYSSLLMKIESILRILSRIIITAQKNLKFPPNLTSNI